MTERKPIPYKPKEDRVLLARLANSIHDEVVDNLPKDTDGNLFWPQWERNYEKLLDSYFHWGFEPGEVLMLASNVLEEE